MGEDVAAANNTSNVQSVSTNGIITSLGSDGAVGTKTAMASYSSENAPVFDATAARPTTFSVGGGMVRVGYRDDTDSEDEAPAKPAAPAAGAAPAAPAAPAAAGGDLLDLMGEDTTPAPAAPAAPAPTAN